MDEFDSSLALEGGDAATEEPVAGGSVRFGQRWWSRRALLLHLEVLVVVAGCLAAAWWQATSALAGNSLSWVYTIEWPIFAIIAVVGWWLLIHEDPAALRARKQRAPAEAPSHDAVSAAVTFDGSSARLATLLAIGVGVEFVLGIAGLVVVPSGHPNTWSPTDWVLYLAHALLGALLALGAVALLSFVRRAGRIARLSGWVGGIGVAFAGAGGLLTVSQPVRVGGLVVMLVGTIVAGFGFLFATFERLT